MDIEDGTSQQHKSDQNDFTCPERWFIYTYLEGTMRRVVDELCCEGRLSYLGLNGEKRNTLN